jgi:predicted outer membrane protein
MTTSRRFGHTTLLVPALGIALSLAACDRRETPATGDLSPDTGANAPAPADTPPPMSTMTTPASGATVMPPSASTMAAPGGALSSADTAFLGDATRSNEEEIATTELGMEHGNAKNKELSRMLNADHVALRGKVATLAPNAPTPPVGKPPADLADMKGEAFDGRLLAVYRQQHEAAIRTFTDASNNPALSEPVRTLAKDTLPKLQAHLQAVKDAQGAE